MANIEERRPTAEVCLRTTSLQRIHKRQAYSPGRAQLCVRIRPCRHYTEHILCTDRENTDVSSSQTVVYYPTNQVRANPTKTQVSLFHLRNRECDKQLDINLNGVNLTHCILPMYIGVTLDHKLSYKARQESRNKKQHNPQTTKLKMGNHSNHTQIVRSSVMLLCRVCLPGVGMLPSMHRNWT